MVIKVYISGISGNKEVKKKQQRVLMILDSKQIEYEAIDITEPGKEKEKEFMQSNGKVRESLGKHPLPPQIFNEDDFCGDYEDFDMANEVDELEKFLHMEIVSKDIENGTKSEEKTVFDEDENYKKLPYNPYEYHTYKVVWDEVNGLQEQIIDSTPAAESIQTEEIENSEVNGIPKDETPNSSVESVNHNKPETSLEDLSIPVKEVQPFEEEATIENNDAANGNMESTESKAEMEVEESITNGGKEENESEKGDESDSQHSEKSEE